MKMAMEIQISAEWLKACGNTDAIGVWLDAEMDANLRVHMSPMGNLWNVTLPDGRKWQVYSSRGVTVREKPEPIKPDVRPARVIILTYYGPTNYRASCWRVKWEGNWQEKPVTKRLSYEGNDMQETVTIAANLYCAWLTEMNKRDGRNWTFAPKSVRYGGLLDRKSYAITIQTAMTEGN